MKNTEILKQLEKAQQNADTHQSRDLYLIISNDRNIYNQSITPTIANLRRKAQKGNFDEVQAIQAFYNIVYSALKNPSFYRYYSYNIQMVSVATRYDTAKQLLEFFIDEIEEAW